MPSTHSTNESADYATFYGPVAQNLLEGRGLTTSNGRIASDYPPGFPAYLAVHFYLADLFGWPRDSVIAVTNVILSSLSCVLAGLIAELLFGSDVSIISVFLWATYLFNLWLIKQPNSEVPFIFLFYLAIYFFVAGIVSTGLVRFGIVGFLCGIAALVRPILLLFPFLLALLLFLRRDMKLSQRSRSAGLIVLGFLIVILPWEAKLGFSTGHLVPLSTNGPASMLDGLTFATKTGKGGDQAWVPTDVHALAQRVRENQRSLRTTGEVIRFMLLQARNDPSSVIQMGIVKTARSWYGTNAMWHERPVAIIQFVYLSLIVPGIWLAWRLFPAQRFFVVMLLAIMLYFWGMTIIALSILRYMVPAIGLLLMFAAVSFDICRKRAGVRFWAETKSLGHNVQ